MGRFVSGGSRCRGVKLTNVGTNELVLITIGSILSARIVRDGWHAPYRPFRWSVRVAGVGVPLFLSFSWLGLLATGGLRELFDGLAMVAMIPTGLGSLGMLLAMATAPSRRR